MSGMDEAQDMNSVDGGTVGGGGSDRDRDGHRRRVLAQAVRLRENGHAEQARELLVPLAELFPHDAEVAHQAAWVHDVLGLEAEAVPYYRTCLDRPGLSDADRRSALLGLGSTYRVLGQYRLAVETLEAAVADHPDDAALKTFLAMALYNTGQAREGMGILLSLLAETSSDPTIARYRPAIEHYAKDLDETE